MEQELENLFLLIRQSMSDFASRIVAAKPGAKSDVGHYSNSAFLLRSYAGFRVDAAGDEVGVTVDVKRHDDGGISIDSEICMADGVIVMPGPAARLSANSPDPASNDAVTQWQEKFKRFLDMSEPLVLAAICQMATAPASQPQHGDGTQKTSMF